MVIAIAGDPPSPPFEGYRVYTSPDQPQNTAFCPPELGGRVNFKVPQQIKSLSPYSSPLQGENARGGGCEGADNSRYKPEDLCVHRSLLKGGE